jgi:branched-chain amino acid transport system permease protein
MTIVAPLLARKGFAVSLLCSIGIMTVFAVSYNMLLGQTGLLSFGHAAYYGLGAVTTIHVLNLAKAGVLPIPVTLLPLAGGLAGLIFGVTFGYITTRRAGTTFAMISLGVGEMVYAGSMMFPSFFGGEGGISGNRVTGKGWFGITYGPQIEMYYLIVGWAFVCLVAMYAISQTPLGRLANAVRDNPERVQFVGYDPQWVRYQKVVLAGFFAGVAGGLSALNYEIVTAEALGAHKSGVVLLMAYVGGIGSFYGPALGAALVTVLQVAVGSVTKAWLFYFGLFFVGMVLFAPGGIASIVEKHRRAWQARMVGPIAAAYLVAAPPAALLVAGIVAVVEMAYAAVNEVEAGSARLVLAGVEVDAKRLLHWAVAVAAIAVGGALLRVAKRPAARRWNEIDARLAAPNRETT